MNTKLHSEFPQLLLQALSKYESEIFFFDYVRYVSNGIRHFEKLGIDWKKAVLSPRFVANGEMLAHVLAFPPGEYKGLQEAFVRRKLCIPPNTDPVTLGIPIEHPTFTMEARERHQKLAYLWILAATIALRFEFEHMAPAREKVAVM